MVDIVFAFCSENFQNNLTVVALLAAVESDWLLDFLCVNSRLFCELYISDVREVPLYSYKLSQMQVSIDQTLITYM